MATQSHAKFGRTGDQASDPANHTTFMDLALIHAQKALDRGDFPVGCVIVYKDEIIATGSRTGTNINTRRPGNEIDHAEIIALRQFYQQAAPVEPGKTRLYCTMEPCLMCYAAILLSGIGTIVYAYEDAMGGGTQLNLRQLTPLYQKRRPTIIPHVRRKESLALFKSFFNNNPNGYWKESVLANYTLSQA